MYAHTEVSIDGRTKAVPILKQGVSVIVLEEGDWILRLSGWWVVQGLLPTYAIAIGGEQIWGGIGCQREFHDPPPGTKYLDRTGGAQVKTQL